MYSAICAKKLGVPFGNLLVATNENRVLADVFQTGKYTTKDRTLVKTKSCAMNILTSSNFERLLSDLFGSDRTLELYNNFISSQEFQLTKTELGILQSIGVTAMEIKEHESDAYLRHINDEYKYLLCPHSAVAAAACNNSGGKMMFAATAHPQKFEHSTEITDRPQPHPWLEQLSQKSLHNNIYPGNI